MFTQFIRNKNLRSILSVLTLFSLNLSCGKKTVPAPSVRNAPSAFFNLAGWKLTLPVDSSGGSGGTGGTQYAALTILPSELTSGFSDDFFYADASGLLVFTAPSNGAVTTPGSGSDHTRSELREIYGGPGADSNTDWNSTIGGTMSATCAVQSVSVNSDEATIGQIHNQTTAFALLMYRPAMHDVALSLYSTLTSGISQRTSIVGGIGLNDKIVYSMNYLGNTLTITVNGIMRSFPVDASWSATPMYFKLGAYHAAPNSGNISGDQTQVSFSSFSLSH
jgi:hypothetical protein